MKIIFIFLLILSISNCNLVRENLEIYKDNYEKKSTSNSATFLTANFFFSRGDVYTASKILNKKVENIELLRLKFFSNLISGNFEEANKTSRRTRKFISHQKFTPTPQRYFNLPNSWE